MGIKPLEGDSEENWYQIFAELQRCTLEVSLDILAFLSDGEIHMATQDVIVTIVNAIQRYSVGFFLVADGLIRHIRSGIRTLGAFLLQIYSETLQHPEISSVVRRITITVVDRLHAMVLV